MEGMTFAMTQANINNKKRKKKNGLRVKGNETTFIFGSNNSIRFQTCIDLRLKWSISRKLFHQKALRLYIYVNSVCFEFIEYASEGIHKNVMRNW